jgi:hypothetical protein
MINVQQPKAAFDAGRPQEDRKSFVDGMPLQSVNNPEKRNAMSTCGERLGHALVELRGDPDVRVVILAGAGGSPSGLVLLCSKISALGLCIAESNGCQSRTHCS